MPDGTLTFSVTLTNAAGNTGAAARATATLEQTPPSGYTVDADQSTYNATTAASAGFTFANAEVGATYAYTITSTGGGTPVSGNGIVASANENVTGINLSGLSDGRLAFRDVDRPVRQCGPDNHGHGDPRPGNSERLHDYLRPKQLRRDDRVLGGLHF